MDRNRQHTGGEPFLTRHQTQFADDVVVMRAALGALPRPVARPFLVVVSGLPGSGKSYFSRRVAERVPVALLESDVLRRSLFTVPTFDATENSRLFRACHAIVRELLVERIPVLLDATNLIEWHREKLCHIAEQAKAKLVLVLMKAPPEVVRHRLAGRALGMDPQDISTADWEVYQKMSSTVEPMRRNHFVVDTSRDISPAVARVVREIDRWVSLRDSKH